MKAQPKPSAPAQLVQLASELEKLRHRPLAENLAATEFFKTASEFLDELMGDVELLLAYTYHLEKVYGAKYDIPLPRGMRVRHLEPAVDPKFPPCEGWEGAAETLFLEQRKIDCLHLRDLLLNPHYLWQLAENIQYQMPEIWVPLLQQWGRRLMERSNLEFKIPGIPEEVWQARKPLLPKEIVPISIVGSGANSLATGL